MKRIIISAVVLAKNEEHRIGKCLSRLSWVDERIVIDNGSTDKTRDIARRHKATIIIDDTHDFSYLRTIGKNHAHGEWLLYVDADEEVTVKLQQALQHIVDTFSEAQDSHGYFIRRENVYLGHSWPYKDKMQRFFWKKSLRKWEGTLHETAIVDGAIGTIEEPLLHDTHRTLEEMTDKTNQWSEVEARLRFSAHHPPVVWWRFLRVMLTAFLDSFVHQGGWRAGVVGWIESIYQAFSMFITYAKLWELQQKDERGST